MKPGDEILLLDPFFLWHPVLYNAGLKIKYSETIYIPSEAGDSFEHKINFEEIDSLIGEDTKAIILICPNNPDGRVWTREESNKLADIVLKHKDLKVFSDEVYNRHIFDNNEFIPFASIPGMRERTVTGYSFGKEFHVTGWRVGAAVGDKKLMEPIIKYGELSVGDISIVSKLAVAYALEAAEKEYIDGKTYYEWLKEDFSERKRRISSALNNTKRLDLKLVNARGGYSFIANFESEIKNIPIAYYYPDSGVPASETRKHIQNVDEFRTLQKPERSIDHAFNDFMIQEFGFGGIPCSSFYYNDLRDLPDWKGMNYIRYSVCKCDETISKLEKLLEVDTN